MAVVCPRCGHRDTFMGGFLPNTCVCRVCQSQLDWREVPGLGSDCRPAKEADKGEHSDGSNGGTGGTVDRDQRRGDE